jgi:hypothetical protein
MRGRLETTRGEPHNCSSLPGATTLSTTTFSITTLNIKVLDATFSIKETHYFAIMLNVVKLSVLLLNVVGPLALSANNRLGWKCLKMTNCGTLLIMGVTSFTR